MFLCAFVLLIFPQLIAAYPRHGSCPEMPESQEFNASIPLLFERRRILMLVPFSKGESHLFPDTAAESSFCLGIAFNEYKSMKIFISSKPGENHMAGTVTGKRDGQFQLTTKIVTMGSIVRSKCQKTLNETIRFWIHGELGIFWSCKEIEGGYEEALILAVSGSYGSNKNSSKLLEYKQLIKGVVREALFERITWIADFSNCTTEMYYSCPGIIHYKLLLVMGYGVGLVFLMCLGFIICKCMSYNENRVGTVP